MSLPARLLGANPSIQVSSLLSGTLTTPSAKGAFTIVGDYEAIQNVILSTSSATIQFTSIPSTYKHLEIRGVGRVNLAGYAQNGCRLQLNGDTGSNYSFQQIYANGSSYGSEGYANQTYGNLGEIASATAPTSVFSPIIIQIFEYTDVNKYKTIKAIGTNDRNGAGQIGVNGSLWRSLSAVTSISLFEPSSSWIAGSNFTLYGIKG